MPQNIKDMSEVGIQAEIAKCRLAIVNNDVCKCADGVVRSGNSLNAYLERLAEALPDGSDKSGLTSPWDGVKPLKYGKGKQNKARVSGIDDKYAIK